MTLGTVLDLVSAILVVMALMSAATTLVVTRRFLVALAVLLDLLTAASLLHLAADQTLTRALSAATVLAIRHVVSRGLMSGRRSRTAAPAAVTKRSRG
jgi:hypothetical protein